MRYLEIGHVLFCLKIDVATCKGVFKLDLGDTSTNIFP